MVESRLKIFLCICLFLSVLMSYSQNKADSLLEVLESADINKKASVYNELSTFYLYEGDYERAKQFANQALEIAEDKDLRQEHLIAKKNLANIEITLGNYERGIDIGNEVVVLADELGSEDTKAFSQFILGNAYYMLNGFDSALVLWQKSLKIREKQNDKERMASLLLSIAVIYKNKGEYKTSIEHNEKALKIMQEMGNDFMVGRILGNIGNIYYYSELDYSKALDYYLESLEYFEKINQLTGKATILNSIGLVYEKQDSLDLALEYFQNSLQIFDELGDEAGKAQNLNSIGNIYLKEDKLDESLEKFHESLEIFERLDTKKDIALAYNDIGDVYFMRKDLRRALRYKLSALNLMKELGLKKEASDMHKDVSDIYASMNDYDNAYEHHYIYARLKDSIINTEYTEQISEWRTKYETEKKEQESKILKAENQKQVAEIKRKNIMLYSFIGLISIVLIFSFLLYKQFTEKKKANELLSVKNEQITKQNKEITDSIQYASRIQNAVLPSSDQLNKIVSNHFILFKPKDIVSGDFYWMTANEHKAVLVAADCTGHGVPGAFMSMLGISFLNEIVNIDQPIKANEILNRLRHLVKTTLAQSGENNANDGMDISLVVLDNKEMTLQFSGAYNHLYIFKNGELNKVKADRMPIGNYVKEKESFTNHEMNIKKGETFYMFSDGYCDQFGGENDQKLTVKALQEKLIKIYKKPMHEQKKILFNNYMKWKGDKKQIDDVLMMGIVV